MAKLPEQMVNEIAQTAILQAETAITRALVGVEDPEQRFVIVAQVAASLFGSAGAHFQISNPGTGIEEAARATLAHIASMLNAYIN